MIFSLERRFLILLLLPVTVILLVAGVAGFLYSRGFLLDQWTVSTRLKLEKAEHQIEMQVEEKLELIRLIGKAEEIPDNDIVRTYLIQQLVRKDGVRFVDLEPVDAKVLEDAKEGKTLENYYQGENGHGTGYATEMCGDIGFCAPVMDPNSSGPNPDNRKTHRA